MMYTRLPFWRLYQPGNAAFRHAVGYWPFVGWLTGGVMMLTLALGLDVLNLPVVALLVIIVRILLTGAFHEDGLADFCDGMGGGKGREDVLRIMKDSRIGTYGVLALLSYFLLLYFCMREITVALGIFSLKPASPCHNPILMTGAVMLSADVWGKCCASLLVGQMPYARREEEAKAGSSYLPYNWAAQFARIVVALLPVALLWWHIGIMPPYAAIVTPFIVEVLLAAWMRRRLRGYTGDCCGATFLLCELSVYIAWIVSLP
ncbi:MAG: adenosylcobinamide-GDP ribazoletransferase [Prevotellaceae bacterium]|nr:adenosylcobinamide-GDP ribazoletransferase [Prevotellaceae bacterium]